MNRNTTAIILIVLAIGIYFTLTKGMIEDANSVRSVNLRYAAAIDSAAKLIKMRDKVVQDFSRVSADDRARLSKMIPQSVDNIRLVIDLNDFALKQGFTFKNIQVSAAASQPKATTPARSNTTAVTGGGAAQNPAGLAMAPVLDTITVSFSVTATYQQFVQLLQALEANLRLMDVTHLTLTANDNGLYEWSVQFKTYWLKSL